MKPDIGQQDISWGRAPRFGRRSTILRTLARLHEGCSGPLNIVETGTLRDGSERACDGDGWSMVAWSWYCAQTGGRAYTVDIDEAALVLCRQLTAEYSDHVECVCSDSVAFLREWSVEKSGPIHLLYLDSLDYHDPEVSEAHNLNEAKAALHALPPQALVLIDDTHPVGALGSADLQNGAPSLTGKGARTVPFLLGTGFALEWVDGGQVLLSRGYGPVSKQEAPAGAAVDSPLPVVARFFIRRPTQAGESAAAIPLHEIPERFRRACEPPARRRLLETVRACNAGGLSACEIASDSPYGAIWLSANGSRSHALVDQPRAVEAFRHINSVLGGSAAFRSLHEEPDLAPFESWTSPVPVADSQASAPRWSVIHHSNLIHFYPAPCIRAMLARQVLRADHVVFTVPSVFHTETQDGSHERLLPLETWAEILAPFRVRNIEYTGNANAQNGDHILCVLDGEESSEQLLSLAQMQHSGYRPGISAIVHTRNEEARIAVCLERLLGWTDEIIVCDMESDDQTVPIAARYTSRIVKHPRIPNFDRARNMSAMLARYEWVLYLDADEHVPAGFGPVLRQFIQQHGHTFDAASLPFTTHFAGRPLNFLHSTYKAPSLYRNGRFFYNARPHQGAQVEGKIICLTPLPVSNPSGVGGTAVAIDHFSYDSVAHYVDKVNGYTSAEAANMDADGQTFDWRKAVDHSVSDMVDYYDGMGARQDGGHGLIYSMLSGWYRLLQHSKLYERRFRQGELTPEERAMPASIQELLRHALSVAEQRSNPVDQTQPASTQESLADESPATVATELQTTHAVVVKDESPVTTESVTEPAEVVWVGPFDHPSGYGDESRNFALALEDARVSVAARSSGWIASDHNLHNLDGAEQSRLSNLLERRARHGHIAIVQDFPQRAAEYLPIVRAEAGKAILRTMFETDRLPAEWVRDCNRFDQVWVPSEFNRETFARSGVTRDRIRVIPGCLDMEPYLSLQDPTALVDGLSAGDRYTFLSVFDWSLHKGWDVLLEAFLRAFEGRDDVRLVLKVWSSLGYTPQNIVDQAANHVRRAMGCELTDDDRVVFIFDRVSTNELISLYQGADAYVMASRGEGWGRPYMEAMACGKPTIGTNWSGNTAYMTDENSFPIRCALKPVSESGWREIPSYRGHRWAEPECEHLTELLRLVVDQPDATAVIGARGQAHIRANYARSVVGALMASELAALSGQILSSQPEVSAIARSTNPGAKPIAKKNGADASTGRATPRPKTSSKMSSKAI